MENSEGCLRNAQTAEPAPQAQREGGSVALECRAYGRLGRGGKEKFSFWRFWRKKVRKVTNLRKRDRPELHSSSAISCLRVL